MLSKAQIRNHHVPEDKQKDYCQICGTGDNLSVDHDHDCCPGSYSCGKCVRGILCVDCNSRLGVLEHYIKWDRFMIVRMLMYLNEEAAADVLLEPKMSDLVGTRGDPLTEVF